MAKSPKLPAVDPNRSVLSLSSSGVLVGDTIIATITLFDSEGKQLTHGGDAVIYHCDNENVTISSVIDNKDGTYCADLTAEKAGQTNILFSVNGSETTVPTELNISEILADKAQSTITTNKQSLAVNDECDIRVTLKTADGELLTGQKVVLVGDVKTIMFPDMKDNNDGIYCCSFKAEKSGKINISFTVNDELFPSTLVLSIQKNEPKEKTKTGKVAPGHTIYYNGQKYTQNMSISMLEADFGVQFSRGVVTL
ncbi:invasin domain 3-containing protein (plasmid) [Orbus sturtevantii]|uniref:Ig-like domain-containing protein n=1 Tax=Orbus sturtevantii TaxID=3074109 RepID=UPI00370D5E0D